MSEADFVAASIKAARELGHGHDYTLDRLIHDGISRVGQELISNAVNKGNRKDKDAPAHTSPGGRWDAYEEAYQELQAIVGTKAWTYRKPYITLSYIAGALKGLSRTLFNFGGGLMELGRRLFPPPSETKISPPEVRLSTTNWFVKRTENDGIALPNL